LAVGPDANVYVTSDGRTPHLVAFTAAGVPAGDRTVIGPPLTGAAVDPHTGQVDVLAGASVVAVDAASGDAHVVACLTSIAAEHCEPGATDHRPSPVAAAYDRAGDLLVTDPAQDTVWQLVAGRGVPAVWYQPPEATFGDGPYGLGVAGASVLVTVGTTADPAAFDGGALYRITVTPSGAAGARTLVAPFPSGAEPGAVAVGSTQTAYVVMRKAGSIVMVSRSGAHEGEVDRPGAGPVPLAEPVALAVVPGTLLVADRGSSAVLSIAERDGPAQ
jgi:hypothetical protein